MMYDQQLIGNNLEAIEQKKTRIAQLEREIVDLLEANQVLKNRMIRDSLDCLMTHCKEVFTATGSKES